MRDRNGMYSWMVKIAKMGFDIQASEIGERTLIPYMVSIWIFKWKFRKLWIGISIKDH